MQRIYRYLLTAVLLLTPVTLTAQVSSATITGTVKDSSGGILPHVKITATETATGVSTVAETNDDGEYTLPLLKTGAYKLVVAIKGFKRYEQMDLLLSAGDHPTEDITLVAGDVDVSIEVTATPPLLGTEDANVGQVVTRQIVDSIPLSGRTPMSLVQYTEGVVATANPVGTRPFDNSAVAAFSVGGLPNKNAEILMDGSPDNASDNAPAYELPMDAAQEVTIKVFESDATYGHSGGAVANQVTKSGTNRLHGSLSEYHQDNDLNDTGYFNKRNPQYSRTVSRQNQFGGTIGGPVWIPKVYNGRDKLFFFFAYEGFYDSGTGGGLTTVPTDAERKGDLSALLPFGALRSNDYKCGNNPVNGVLAAPYNQYQIYDPATATLDAACAAKGYTVYDRQPFANNIITTGALPLSAVAQAAVKYYPEPTNPNAYLGFNNYYQTAETGDRYNNELGRIDYVLPHQRLYLTGRHNQRLQYNNFQLGNSNPALGDYLYRINYGGSVGDVVTFSPTLLGEIRLNYTRYSQPSYTAGDGFDPTSLGLPNLASAHKMFPRFFFNGGSLINLGATTQTPGTAPFDSDDVFLNFIKTKGLHTVKFGADFRKFQKGNFTFGNSSGLYNFDNSFTAPFTGSNPNFAFQADTAAFLLGLPSSASYDYNAHSIGNQTYLGLFIQDDWRATPHLTINAGLRMDKDFSPNEREGTAVSGFDPSSTNPYSAAATAAYAASPNSTLPVANFKVLGGLTFNSPGNTLYSTFPSVMFSPRFGLSYTPTFVKNTVVRAGFGLFVLPIFPFNNSINQSGFSQTTQAPIANYIAPTANGPGTLANPFPTGLAPIVGSSLGLATFAGQALTFLDPVIRNGYSERWHLGFQHQFLHSWMADVFYEGSTGRRLPINESLNFVQRQYETTASNTGLSAGVSNPFYGLIPNGGSLNSSKTVALTTLLQTYPEFGAITEQNVPEGSSIYHALDFHVEHRTGYGLSMFANYQWSKLLEAVSFLNASDPKPEYRISQYDHPTHAVIVVSDELPFGRGRHFGANAPRWLDLPLGGWNLASSWYYQQGAPLSWGNLTPVAGQAVGLNPRMATENGSYSSTCPALNVNAFQNGTSTLPGTNCGNPNTTLNIQPSNNLRTFPSQFSNLRADAWNDWDASLMKNFNITEHGGTYFQLRLDAFNVNNRPVFSTPNLSASSSGFGQILGTANANNGARFLQVGAKLSF
jgi:hypothetical protein